jgi:hypothetical protein
VKYLLVLGAVLAVIGVVVWILVLALNAASRGASGLGAWIGRKHYRVIPVIPAELDQLSRNRSDAERVALTSYAPPVLPVAVNRFGFEPFAVTLENSPARIKSEGAKWAKVIR